MANADTPGDALAARKNGAEGIGLCRTEHMVGVNFFTVCFFEDLFCYDSYSLQFNFRSELYGHKSALLGK